MSDRREEIQVSLVSQLGSDPRYLAQLKHDMRKLSYIFENTRIPPNFRTILFFRVLHRVVDLGEEFDEVLPDEFLHLSLSIEGKGTVSLLRGEQVSKGSPVNLEAEVAPPGIWDKIFNKQKVEAYERQEREKLELTP